MGNCENNYLLPVYVTDFEVCPLAGRIIIVTIIILQTLNILWHFEIQTYHQIPARRPDLVIIYKKKENLLNRGFCRSSGPQSKNQRKRTKRQILRPCQRTEKGIEHAVDTDTNHIYPTPPLGQDMTQGQFLSEGNLEGVAHPWNCGSRHSKHCEWPNRHPPQKIIFSAPSSSVREHVHYR